MSLYRISELGHAYPGGPWVFRGVSFTLAEGAILTILGPNGSGKSTLMQCMAGHLSPKEGSITLCGKPLERLASGAVARLAGYVPQLQPAAFSYPVLHYTAMGSAARIGLFAQPGEQDRKIALQALSGLGIEHLADRSYGELSGGERQQVSIARALAQQPRVLLLDEPTAHLDIGKQECVLSIIKSLAGRGLAVVMTTHNPDHALLLGGDVGLINHDGAFRCGPCASMISEEVLTDAYRAPLRVVDVEALSRRACLPPALR